MSRRGLRQHRHLNIRELGENWLSIRSIWIVRYSSERRLVAVYLVESAPRREGVQLSGTSDKHSVAVLTNQINRNLVHLKRP
jgi:hypothetical protein